MKITKYKNDTKTAIWYVHKQLEKEGKIIHLGNGSKKKANLNITKLLGVNFMIWIYTEVMKKKWNIFYLI